MSYFVFFLFVFFFPGRKRNTSGELVIGFQRCALRICMFFYWVRILDPSFYNEHV
jgi:hypothetical protein